MSSYIKQLSESKLVRNVATMLAGNVCAQLIAFLAAPVITRLYSPDEFGLMTLIWAYCGIAMVVSCLSYEQPVIIEKDATDALTLWGVSVYVAVLLFLIASVVLICLSKKIADVLQFGFDNRLLWFIPIAILISGIHRASTSLGTRKKQFRLISTWTALGSVFAAVFKILVALLFVSSGIWLTIGNLLYLLVPAIILSFVGIHDNYNQLKKALSFSRIQNLAIKYRRFPTYQVATNLLNAASQNLPIALFAVYFSPAIIGFYGLANAVMRRPLSLIGQSLSNVLLQKISEIEIGGRQLKKTYLQTTKGLILIGLIPFLIVGIWGSELFSIVFGVGWTEAGSYAQLLTPWLFLGFINPPSVQIVVIKQKLKFNMVYNILLLLCRILVVVLVSLLFSSAKVTIGMYSFVGVIFNLFYIYYAYRLSSS